MDFNFPTMKTEPLIQVDYFKGTVTNVCKQIEEKLGKIFRETRKQSKYYLLSFSEKIAEVNEFTDESYYVANMDLLIECYYDPIGNVHFSYSKFQKIKPGFHLEALRKNY